MAGYFSSSFANKASIGVVSAAPDSVTATAVDVDVDVGVVDSSLISPKCCSRRRWVSEVMHGGVAMMGRRSQHYSSHQWQKQRAVHALVKVLAASFINVSVARRS